ncbi:hypothetical protein J1N35_028327 [Gossypium stocksii]|uniref:Uncharacterized protein n=1 Tax=Gossypium stocksii TaxID=47602 RepID=A0A9D3ZSJ5_9ROSI|nr:hypothetical protein J1N35_028327 [Gossypium stocksii]
MASFMLLHANQSSTFSKSNGYNDVNCVDFFIRTLLERELDMLNRLREVVSSKVLVPEEKDRLIWIHDNKGVFLVKKLLELLIEEGVEDISFIFDKI